MKNTWTSKDDFIHRLNYLLLLFLDTKTLNLHQAY